MNNLLYFWLGASADADPALVASDQAAARLAPTGVDPLRGRDWNGFTCIYSKFWVRP